jgi:hypothetical protein
MSETAQIILATGGMFYLIMLGFAVIYYAANKKK